MCKTVLLDENMPQPLRLRLVGHTVITATYQGWAGKANGELIALAETEKFDVMVTADQNLSYQQNMQGRKLALVVLSTPNKKRVLVNAPRILAAVNAAEVGSYTFVDFGN